MTWEDIVHAVEKVKGEAWDDFRDRYGDWGRDLALWVGRREGGFTLKALGEKAGGMDYGTVANALHRFTKKLNQNPTLTKAYQKVLKSIAHFLKCDPSDLVFLRLYSVS